MTKTMKISISMGSFHDRGEYSKTFTLPQEQDAAADYFRRLHMAEQYCTCGGPAVRAERYEDVDAVLGWVQSLAVRS